MDIDWVNLTTIFSNVATAITLPVTAAIFLHDTHKDRIAKQHEIDADLVGSYFEINNLFIEHPELDKHDCTLEDPQDRRRQYRMYEMIVSLFEKAYLRLSKETDQNLTNMWASWENYIDDWVDEPNFRDTLPRLLRGENPDFAAFMRAKVADKMKMQQALLALPLAAPAPGAAARQ